MVGRLPTYHSISATDKVYSAISAMRLVIGDFCGFLYYRTMGCLW